MVRIGNLARPLQRLVELKPLADVARLHSNASLHGKPSRSPLAAGVTGNPTFPPTVVRAVKRILMPLGMVAAVLVILVLTYRNLETEPVQRDEPAAVILRAPDGYSVQELGESTLASAARFGEFLQPNSCSTSRIQYAREQPMSDCEERELQTQKVPLTDEEGVKSIVVDTIAGLWDIMSARSAVP